jgi:hypothetical protein
MNGPPVSRAFKLTGVDPAAQSRAPYQAGSVASKESPAAPHTCRAFFDLFRLELCLACAIGKASIPHDLDENPSYLARFLTIRGETGGYFIVRDHNRQPLAYLSFEDEPGGAAQGIAANIAEHPDGRT